MAVPEPPHQRQNFLGGFKLTLEHLGRPPVTRQYPEEKRPKQPRQHGRHVLNRYEDGMEKCIGCELCAGVCPADCIYVRGLDNPPDHPVSPGRALRLRLRDQLPAVHPLRPVRGGLPHRGHHRVEAVGVLLHQPQRRHLHQGRAAGRRRRQAPAPCRGRTGGRATTCTPRDGCGPPRRRAAPSSRARSSGPASSGFGVRAPEGGQSGHRDDASHRKSPAPRHARAPPAHLRPAGREAGTAGCHRAHAGEGRALRARGRQEAPREGGRRLRRRRGGRQLRARRVGHRRTDPPPASRIGGSQPPTPGRTVVMPGCRIAGGGRHQLHARLLGRRRRLRRGRGHHPGRRHRRGGGPQPGALGPHAGHDPVRRGRAVRTPAGPASWPPCR